MTFVRDDQVERVNGDVEFVSVRLGFDIAAALNEATFHAKKIPRHALDGGDVNERVRRNSGWSGIHSAAPLGRTVHRRRNPLSGIFGCKLRIPA
jgi:hypothetical protein